MSHITSGYCKSNIGINHHPTYWGYINIEDQKLQKNLNFSTCYKHNLLLPNGACDACMAEELSKRLREREKVEAMVKPEEKAQRQESVDLNSYEEQKALRTKALELAIASYGESIKTATSLGILTFAKTFYTYITKGE